MHFWELAPPAAGGQSCSSHQLRRSLLIRALLAEGLTLPRLTEAAKMPSGFHVLIDMLEMSQEERGVELSRGERLALARRGR